MQFRRFNKKKFTTLAGLAGATLISASAIVMAQPTTAVTDQEYERMFVEMDTNKDGRVSRTEYANYRSSRFDSWDKSHEGMTREQIRTKIFERERRKSDRNPQGNSPNSVQKK